MSNTSVHLDAVNRLAAQADAVGRLAQDSGGFAAVVAAFESRDPNAFRWVLERLDLVPYCELICEWVRIKLCALRCAEICVPIREETEAPSLQQFAQAVAHLSASEQALRRVVDALACGDGKDYDAALQELKLARFCHLICYWVCSVGYARICEIICRPGPTIASDALGELRTVGEVAGRLVKNAKALEVISSAAVALNCETLRLSISEAGFAPDCEIICRLICVWRSTLVCRELCEVPPPILTGVLAVEEAQNFALAARTLANQPRALGDLVSAVQNRDAKSYREIVTRFRLVPFCWQLCSWISSVTCYEFCICVCPAELYPFFTSIGSLLYETQVDSALPATGLTVGGTPLRATQAFWGTLRLNGVLPPTLGGQPYEYSFWYQPVKIASTNLSNPIGAGDTSITVTSSAPFPSPTPPHTFNAVIGSANGDYEIITVTAVSGTTWTVIRGRQGTTAAPAAAGAGILSGVAAAGQWTQIPENWIARTVIGIQELAVPPFARDVTVHGNLPGDLNIISFTPDGWIQVPQAAIQQGISLTGDMISLDTTQLPGFGPAFYADETGVSAGNPANHPLPTDLYFGIQMRVRPQGSNSSGTAAGTCSVVAIDNNLYNNVNHHPDWAGYNLPNQPAVVMVDIKELQAGGCAKLSKSLTVLFTASHPNLGPVSVTMTGPGGPYDFTLPTPIPETGDWYGVAIPPPGFQVAKLVPCAYLVTLGVNLLLTNGDVDFTETLVDQIAFCHT